MTDDLVADLTRQLREIMVAAEQKERIIEGLKAASDERLRLIERLDAELRQLRVQLEDKERAYLDVTQSARATQAAADERLRAIERLSVDALELRAQLEASHRERTELESAARERLAIVEHLRSELEICHAQLRTAGFVARVGVRVIQAQQTDHDDVHRHQGEPERQSVEPG